MIHPVYPTGDRPIRRALDAAQQGDTLDLYPGVYQEEISTYDGPIAPDLTIRAYRSGDVTLAPVGTQRVVTLTAGADGMRLIGLMIDAARVLIDGVKLTHNGGNPPIWRVTIDRCEIWGAPRQGILAAGAYHRITRCRIHHCGTTVGLDHGIYLSGSRSLIERCDLWGNAASGICVYDGSGQGNAFQNRVRYCRVWSNSRLGRGAGILLAGEGHIAERNVAWGNDVNLQVYDDGHGAQLLDNVVGAHSNLYTGPVYISPQAVGTVERGTERV